MKIPHYLRTKYLILILLGVLTLSCEETLFETDISDENVQLLAPADGVSLDFTSINFNWSSIEEANQYNFQVATPNFANANQIIEDLTFDSITQHTLTLNENEYQWRVKAMNSGFETAFSIASFTVVSNADFPSNVIVLTAPEDNLITNQNTITLQWDPVSEATNYHVQIIDNESQTVTDEMDVSENTYEYVFADGDYTWQVRAEKDTEATLYFARTILVDTQVPNTISLLTPLDEEILTDENVNFTWSREFLEGSTEFDSIFIYSDMTLETLVNKEQVSNSYDLVLSNANYYWLMQAFDEAGNQSETSETFSFTVNQ